MTIRIILDNMYVLYVIGYIVLIQLNSFVFYIINYLIRNIIPIVGWRIVLLKGVPRDVVGNGSIYHTRVYRGGGVNGSMLPVYPNYENYRTNVIVCIVLIVKAKSNVYKYINAIL